MIQVIPFFSLLIIVRHAHGLRCVWSSATRHTQSMDNSSSDDLASLLRGVLAMTRYGGIRPIQPEPFLGIPLQAAKMLT